MIVLPVLVLPFLPTPEQIARGCADARALWSDVRRMRALRGRGRVGLSAIHLHCRGKTAIGLTRRGRGPAAGRGVP